MSTQSPAAQSAAQPSGAKPSNTVTWALVAAALVVAGFLGGYLVGHHAASDRFDFASRHMFPGPPGFGGSNPGMNPGFGGSNSGINPGIGGSGSGTTPGFGGPSFGDIAFGTVTRVGGSTIYLREPNGTNVKVQTTGSTQLRLANGGTVATLKPGDTIFVRGTAAGTGTIKAAGIFQPVFPQAAPST